MLARIGSGCGMLAMARRRAGSRAGSWQAEAMRAYLVTGNPGSGKSTLAAELSRRGLIAVDADDLAFWEDRSGVRVDQPPGADDDWLRAHRWVWSRTRPDCPARRRAAGILAGSHRGDQTADPRRPSCLPGPDARQGSDPPGRDRVTPGPRGQPAGPPRPWRMTAGLLGSCAEGGRVCGATSDATPTLRP